MTEYLNKNKPLREERDYYVIISHLYLADL